MSPRLRISIGYKLESVRVSNGSLDFLTKGNKGVNFMHLDNQDFLKSLEERAVQGQMLSQNVRFVSLEDLIVLKSIADKQRSGGKDRMDLTNLLPQPHDQAYVAKWLKHFGV